MRGAAASNSTVGTVDAPGEAQAPSLFHGAGAGLDVLGGEAAGAGLPAGVGDGAKVLIAVALPTSAGKVDVMKCPEPPAS